VKRPKCSPRTGPTAACRESRQTRPARSIGNAHPRAVTRRSAPSPTSSASVSKPAPRAIHGSTGRRDAKSHSSSRQQAGCWGVASLRSLRYVGSESSEGGCDG
jgi:hypothetical protein